MSSDGGVPVSLGRRGSVPTHRDPVCGMFVDPARSAGTFEHHGTVYYFCNPRCRDRFSADPERFLNAPPAPDPQAAMRAGPDAVYVCPMCPEIRETSPGPCPSCGMALEPAEPDLSNDKGPSAELVDMTRRLALASALSFPVFLIAMAQMLPGRALLARLPAGSLGWVELVLSAPVVLWAGWPLFVRMARSLVSGRLNMFTLIGLGTGTAFLTSVAAVLAPQVFPASFRDHMGEAPRYFEAAAVIVTLVLLGRCSSCGPASGPARPCAAS
jgi:Cu+-exporting ATPase